MGVFKSLHAEAARQALDDRQTVYIVRFREQSGQVSGKGKVFSTELVAYHIQEIESAGWLLHHVTHVYKQSGLIVGTYIFRPALSRHHQ
jgi:hypothetical protein